MYAYADGTKLDKSFTGNGLSRDLSLTLVLVAQVPYNDGKFFSQRL